MDAIFRIILQYTCRCVSHCQKIWQEIGANSFKGAGRLKIIGHSGAVRAETEGGDGEKDTVDGSPVLHLAVGTQA